MDDRKASARFWDFALAVYGREDARAAFLRLQDDGGADVPMLLWCLWCAAEGQGVSRAQMTTAVAFSRAWRRAMVDPLRAVRRGVKPGIDNVPGALTAEGRALVAQTEQALERMQMNALAGMVAGESDTDPGDTLLLYADVAGLRLDPDDLATIAAA
jgi:uncharacterized protein (TIGR02444 family)